jgi:hypothetical protein
MKCFEVTVNDGSPAIVGAPAAGLLRGSFFLVTSGKGGVVFSARPDSEPARSETLEWVSCPLVTGDEVRVKIVESEHPTEPITRSVHGTAVHPESPRLSCSVCKRPEAKVNQLVAAGAFSICDECVELCYESLGRNRK